MPMETTADTAIAGGVAAPTALGAGVGVDERAWRTFDVSVQHLLGMAVRQPLQQLLHVALDLGDGELLSSVRETGQVVLTEFHHHVDGAFALIVVRAWHGASEVGATCRVGTPVRMQGREGGRRAGQPVFPGLRGREGRAPFEVTISFSLTTFWWFKIFRILISRIAVTGNCTPEHQGVRRDPRERMGRQGERHARRPPQVDLPPLH